MNLEKALLASGDIKNVDLYQALVEWRKKEAIQRGLSVHSILQQKAIIGVANSSPLNERALLNVPCIGRKTIERYGKAILEIVCQYI